MPCLLVQPTSFIDTRTGEKSAFLQCSGAPPASRLQPQFVSPCSWEPSATAQPQRASPTGSWAPSEVAAGRPQLQLVTPPGSWVLSEFAAGDAQQDRASVLAPGAPSTPASSASAQSFARPSGSASALDADEIWRLSQTSYNTKVQDAIWSADAVEQDIFLDAFRGRVAQATACGSANHVLQKLIVSTRPESCHFVLDEILCGTGAMRTACHRFGCRVVQRLLEHCLPHQLERLVDDLLAEGRRLACHRFGSYVAQRLLEHGGSADATRLSQQLLHSVPQLASTAHGCAVLRLALAKGEDACRRQVTGAVLGVSAQDLRGAVCSRFAHVAVLAALELVEGAERQRAVFAVLSSCQQPSGNRFSRIVQQRILERAAQPASPLAAP